MFWDASLLIVIHEASGEECFTTPLRTSVMIIKTDLTLEEFWALPEGETAYELVDGRAINYRYTASRFRVIAPVDF